MSETMREFRATSQAHMWREMQAGRTWTCSCAACVEMRKLIGMDKLLGVWPLVRALQETEGEFAQMPEGAAKEALQARRAKLYDELAVEMTR